MMGLSLVGEFAPVSAGELSSVYVVSAGGGFGGVLILVFAGELV